MFRQEPFALRKFCRTKLGRKVDGLGAEAVVSEEDVPSENELAGGADGSFRAGAVGSLGLGGSTTWGYVVESDMTLPFFVAVLGPPLLVVKSAASFVVVLRGVSSSFAITVR